MESISDFLNKISNKRLLVVFPHPDDEAVMAGGLIQRVLKLGFEVGVLCLTCGEKGENHADPNRSLAEIRSEEFDRAMKILGVRQNELWTYCDGHLVKETDWQDNLEKFIEQFNPGLVVGYDQKRGVTGHPDHRIVGEFLVKSKKSTGWKLISPHFDYFPKWMIVEEVEKNTGAVMRLKLRPIEAFNKWRAVAAHRSQKLHRKWWMEIRFWIKTYAEEGFLIVE